MYETDFQSMNEYLRTHYMWLTARMVKAEVCNDKMRFVLDCTTADSWRFKGYTIDEEEIAKYDEFDCQERSQH